MATKITQDEINAYVWRACDTFRGTIDPSQYKDYILVFLFLKYLSDIIKDKREEYDKKYKGDKERIKRALERERFVLPNKCDFDYIYTQRNEPNIGDIINKALDAIEEANKKKLEGVFRNIDFNSEANLGQTKDRNRILKNLIEDFSSESLNLRPSNIGNQDVIGNTYEYLIARFASSAGKKGGEFYTPAEVSSLLARLLQPKPGMRICDPASGSGSLLIKVANEITTHDFSLYAQESNGSTWALCKMNMLLHGIDNARIEWTNTILSPRLVESDKLMKFDIVVANPPFSLDKWGFEEAANDKFNRFWRGVPPKSTGDYAFISHMIETTVEGTGRVGVIVPHGVLFRSGAEGKIRQQFIEENLLECVIGLPAKLFYGTGIPAAILIFNRGKKTKDVLFIDASREYLEGKNQNRLREEDIKKIFSTYKKNEDVEKYAHRATLEEIKENDFNLNIPRYVDTFEAEPEVDIKAVKKEIADLEEQLGKVRKEMDKYLQELGY
ncbi:MAG TPA: type I restriction-modification system subunit M [Bacteroidia bacterium]|jgi:type I restriction enzyme M protein|nr:type I restriction-modification system subunit M [Bacteroidia bacterium]